MTIGQLARRAGVSTDTIRYYERIDLLQRPARAANGYRNYPDGALVRLQLIRNAISLGYPLKEIVQYLKVRDRGGVPCRQVRAYGDQLLATLDERIRELESLRATLTTTLRNWDERLAETKAGDRAKLLELPVAARRNPRHRNVRSTSTRRDVRRT
jgi:DNA-binding transcriptional MerR regulator